MKCPHHSQKRKLKRQSKKLKNRKSPGIDNLVGEYLKYAPDIIHSEISEILNIMAKTGEYPLEIRKGILNPLPKPGKKAGPPENLRPIILLSILRKILAICLIERCWSKLSTQIPLSQAAYQVGRSTTEQVFAIKLLAEKAITSQTTQFSS